MEAGTTGLSASFSNFFEKIWGVIQKEQTALKFYCRIPDQQILPSGFVSQVFQPNESYFEIRLAEMFLANRREYWEEHIPLGVVLSDFLYNRQRQTVPFLVGNQLLKPIEKFLDGQYVEYYNTRIAGPIPYMGDDVGLFMGLFRSPVKNRAEALFSFMETLVGAFDLGQLTPYLKIAQQVRTGLGNLLGIAEQGVQYRMGNRDVFVDPMLNPDDPKAFRDGYLVYINCPENALDPKTLRVEDDRLHVQKNGSLEQLRSYDYCLIRVKSLPFRNDYTTFPCYEYWLEAIKRLRERDIPGAEGKLREFTLQLSLSPDVTEKHCYELIAAFEGNFYQEVEKIQARQGAQVKRSSTRSATIVMTAPDSLQKIAYTAEQVGLGKEKPAVQVLWDVHQNWTRIPYLAERPEGFDWLDPKQDKEVNQLINQQLQEVSKISTASKPDPKALADALMAAYLSPK
jgi:hypothetical protein